jgi:hypothetical protein
MPRVLSYTPSWLSRPSMGFQIFADPKSPKETHVARLVARHGTQIFIATQNNEIRWTDLVYLKDYEADARSRRATPSSEVSYPETLFRVSLSIYTSSFSATATILTASVARQTCRPRENNPTQRLPQRRFLSYNYN